MQRQTQPAAPATNIKMPDELRTRLQNLAAARRRTLHALMLQALETFVAREEQRESLRREGVAAWEEYKRTGLHLTQEELEAWAEKIGRGERAPMPKCRV